MYVPRMQIKEETTTNKSIFQRQLKSTVTKSLLVNWNVVSQPKSRMRSEAGINRGSTLFKTSSVYPVGG